MKYLPITKDELSTFPIYETKEDALKNALEWYSKREDDLVVLEVSREFEVDTNVSLKEII